MRRLQFNQANSSTLTDLMHEFRWPQGILAHCCQLTMQGRAPNLRVLSNSMGANRGVSSCKPMIEPKRAN